MDDKEQQLRELQHAFLRAVQSVKTEKQSQQYPSNTHALTHSMELQASAESVVSAVKQAIGELHLEIDIDAIKSWNKQLLSEDDYLLWEQYVLPELRSYRHKEEFK